MKFCNRCLYPENHPYGMIFDEQGVCMGCRVHEEKDYLDWMKLFERLKNIVTKYKSEFKNTFDCIIPVTGGSDSYYVVHIVKNILKMNPLLVNYNSHYNTHVGIRNLANLQTVFDCDLITSTISPHLLKKITRYTFKTYGNIYWQVLAGNSTFPVQIAVKYKIPLIIWGVHGWSEQNGMFSHLDEVEMTERCRKEHCLMGISAESLINNDSNITRPDIQPFVYPYDNEIEQIGVRGIYLSNFIRWDSKKQHEEMIKKYGFEAAYQQRTFNTYEDVHCFHSAGIHDYLKLLKYGYSKVTDHASREIRLGRLTREDGISLVKKYQYNEPKDKDVFLNWANISNNEYEEMLDKIRNKNLWEKNENNKWRLRFDIANYNKKNIEQSRIAKNSNCNFEISENEKSANDYNEYLLMGRGYIDRYNYGAFEDRPKGIKMKKRTWRKPSIK